MVLLEKKRMINIYLNIIQLNQVKLSQGVWKVKTAKRFKMKTQGQIFYINI